MANRRFEMCEYRQVIHRMRMGESDWAIAKSGLMGRIRCARLRHIAEESGWLAGMPFPDDSELAKIFGVTKTTNPTQQSLSLVHQERIREWIGQGIRVMPVKN